MQGQGNRSGLSKAQLRVSRHLQKFEHGPHPADQPVSQGPGNRGRQKGADRLRAPLRPSGGEPRVCARAGNPPRRRIPQDCAGTH